MDLTNLGEELYILKNIQHKKTVYSNIYSRFNLNISNKSTYHFYITITINIPKL